TATDHVGQIVIPKSVIATGTTSSAKATVPFTGIVAYFKDLASPSGLPSSYTVTIDWGDNVIFGDTSAGTVAANSSGGFQVTASHTYDKPGTYTVLVTISRIDSSTGEADMVSVFATITVDALDFNPSVKP